MSTESITASLRHHWRLDERAAEALGERIHLSEQDHYIHNVVESLDDESTKWRDDHRERIANIFTGASNEGLVVLGPCSLDAHTDYSVLFDYVNQLQDTYPDTLFAVRANSAKPRTSGGWTGLWYSSDPNERQKVFDIYDEALRHHIPVLAEVTQPTQVGALAPWMSGIWLGARDISSTTLRTMASAIHLPIGIKNGIDGDPETIKNTLKAIRSNTEMNDGSGVDLETVASTAFFPGIPTGILPVTEGNHQAAIIARGYDLPEGMSAVERRAAALDYISQMCILGAEMGSTVLIDGTHGVPPMFDIPRKDPDRIIPVLHEIKEAVRSGEVKRSDRLSGIVAEVGPNLGKTDPNYVLDDERKANLARLIGETIEMVQTAK